MIKVFTLNENGKIEITKEELQSLLDRNYWDGYNNGQAQRSWTYYSPYGKDYITTCTTSSNSINASTIDNTTNGITVATKEK